jgi:C4-dicarboxylate-specific signal transduction histidine kinase
MPKALRDSQQRQARRRSSSLGRTLSGRSDMVARQAVARAGRRSTLAAFAASVAHEVNQPLTAVAANCEAALRWLQAKRPNLEEARKSIEDALGDAHRIGSIVTRVRTLLTRGQARAGSLDINDVVREALELTRPEQDACGVSVRTRLSKLPPVRGDQAQLHQVIRNLILNAIEAMSSSKRRQRQLAVTTRVKRPGSILVAVADTGPGIPPRAAERLFDPFFTTKAGGLGVGLAISSSIIEAHGGRLWATPNRPRGAVFQFTLPTVGKKLR